MSSEGNTSHGVNGSTCTVPDLGHSEGFELESPDLSKAENICLFVTLAGHPTNFIFVPVKYEDALQLLQDEMSEFYNREELEELTEQQVVVNKVYAARDTGDVWHRVVVIDTVIGTRVPLRSCDYGECRLTPISSLRELKPEFKKQPFMAVKGQLAGVKPIVDNWSREDCLRFQDLVEDQILTGTIVGILDNKMNPMERIVFLNLTDESNEDLAELFVSENRAVRDG